MTTFADIIEETSAVLRGYTRNQDQSTYLTADFSNGDSSFTVAKGSRLSSAVVQIGDELIEVDDVDRVSGVVTVPPYGRGAQGTDITATHLTNSRVTSNPTFPRFRIKKAIQNNVLSLGDLLFDVQRHVFAADSTRLSFELPASTSAVFDVRWLTPDSTGNWQPVLNWDVNLSADLTDFPSGVSIDIADYIAEGCDVIVTVGVDPSEFTDDSDTLASVGISEPARDLLVYGAVWRLLSGVDAARLSSTSLTGAELVDQTQPSQYGNLTQQIWRVYQIRMQAEVAEQQRRHPGKIHRVRS